MPLGLPAPGIVRTPDNFEAPIKAFVDGIETAVQTANTAAAAAVTTAGQKYTKPGAGIPDSDLTAATQAKLTATVVFTTSATVRPAGGMCIFTGADPAAVAVAGDLWVGDSA